MSQPQFSNNASNNQTSIPSMRSTMKSSTTTNKSSEKPTFEVISPDKLFILYEQRKGTQYFIPEGFEPVLIPTNNNGTQVPPANLLSVNGKKGNTTKLNKSNQQLLQQQKQQFLLHQLQQQQRQQVQLQQQQQQQQIPANAHIQQHFVNNNLMSGTSSSDVKFPSLVLTRPTGPSLRGGSVSKAVKQKKPPRPPNAFILYRRTKQPTIVAANEGITNNEVSKQVGEMWHKEPIEEKMKYQKMADAAKLEHMKKYPEYKYRPRRPHEKRRRSKRPSNASSTSASSVNQKNGVSLSPSTTPILSNSPLMDHEHKEEFNDFSVAAQRRSSIESAVSSIDTIQLDCSNYEDFSRRGSFASTIDYDANNDISSVMFSSPVALSPPIAAAQVVVPPVGQSDTIMPSDQVCFETAFDSFDLSSTMMMEGVSPGEEYDMNSFGFLNPSEYPIYPVEDSFDYLNFETFDLSALISSNEQFMCELPTPQH